MIIKVMRGKREGVKGERNKIKEGRKRRTKTRVLNWGKWKYKENAKVCKGKDRTRGGERMGKKRA